MIYFHPVPQELYESQEAEYERFRLLVTSIAPADARTINFNGSGYDWFRKDYSNYIDNGHLSEKGQSIIMKILHDEFQ
jgi:lysophospholipase L1-like esterase